LESGIGDGRTSKPLMIPIFGLIEVSFDRWSHVVGVIKSGAKLDMESKEADALVNHGFLRRSYSLEEGSL